MTRIAAVALLLPGSYAAILGTLFAASGGDSTAVWVAAAGWAATVLAAALAWRAWPSIPLPRLLGVVVGAFALSVVVIYAAWLLSYGVTINAELCGEGASSGVAFALGAVAYAGLGAALTRRPGSLFWTWPVAAVAGVAVHLLFLALLPGAHGFCET